MTPRKINIRRLESSKHTVYWKKAQDFYQGTLTASNDKNWNSLVLNAVHCAISAADALLVKKKGIRCSSKDHFDIVELLRTNIDDKEITKYSASLSKIIDFKHLVEYEDRSVLEKEAYDIFLKTDRFYNWIKSKLS
jgi:hypothetical protein